MNHMRPWLRKQVGSCAVLALAAVLAFTGSRPARAEEGRSSLGARLRSTLFGAGVDGLGFVAHLGSSDRWQPYFSMVGGVRFFAQPVPNPRGIRFNFSADVGGGVAFRVGTAHRVALGVALHHLSKWRPRERQPELQRLRRDGERRETVEPRRQLRRIALPSASS